MDGEAQSDFGAEPVQLPIEEALDLHPIASVDVRDVVLEYLRLAQEKGFDRVRLIHGKGVGERKRMIQKMLRAHPEVISYELAPEGFGSWGATLVRLRRKPV
jgi:DNA-nicking Smr family endonuclease